MLKVHTIAACQSVITTFECSPGTHADLVDKLQEAYRDFISQQPGFIAAGLDVNDAQTRIANCSQGAKSEDFQAMLRSEEMRSRNREIAALATRFEPMMYEGAGIF